MIKYVDQHPDGTFHWELFNPEDGFHVTSNLYEAVDGKMVDTGKDVFLRSTPALLDIGIMGEPCTARYFCKVDCYQGRASKHGKNMSLETFKKIIDQVKGKTFQCALGGSGNPDDHPDIVEICKYARENGVVPSFTTSGIFTTEEKIKALKPYVGAIAVSWCHPANYRDKAIQMLLDNGITTNIHFVLGNDTIDEAIWQVDYAGTDDGSKCLIKYNPFPKGINAVIHLLYKPVGLGRLENVLDVADPRVKQFFTMIDNSNLHYKVGFDSCACSGVLNFCDNIDTRSFDACESGRMSAYITADNYLIPCSFDNQNRKYAVSLDEFTVEEAWNSPQFNAFRQSFIKSCPSCTKRELCYGSCPLERDIVLCDSKDKELL